MSQVAPLPEPERRAPGPVPDPGDLRGYEPIHPGGGLRRLGRRVAAPVAAIAALLAKFKTAALLVLKLKLFTTAGTMLVSVAAYAWLWGWRFAAGFVALLLVHELGHVIEARRQGIPVKGVYFVPFMGAVMLARNGGKDAAAQAWLGLAGPILGGAAAFVVWGIGEAVGSQLLVALAFTAFLLNLFNLIPLAPLDGGWATAVFHPLFWVVGLAGLVALAFVWPSPVLFIVIAVGGFELWQRWRRRNDPALQRYLDVHPRQRLAIAAVYLCLAAALALGMSASHQKRTFSDGGGPARTALIAPPPAPARATPA